MFKFINSAVNISFIPMGLIIQNINNSFLNSSISKLEMAQAIDLIKHQRTQVIDENEKGLEY